MKSFRDDQAILAIEFESLDLGYPLSLRQYLKELLKTLWKEGEVRNFQGNDLLAIEIGSTRSMRRLLKRVLLRANLIKMVS
jgi:hypothetical protein